MPETYWRARIVYLSAALVVVAAVPIVLHQRSNGLPDPATGQPSPEREQLESALDVDMPVMTSVAPTLLPADDPEPPRVPAFADTPLVSPDMHVLEHAGIARRTGAQW